MAWTRGIWGWTEVGTLLVLEKEPRGVTDGWMGSGGPVGSKADLVPSPIP
jgi:hypothetical protein